MELCHVTRVSCSPRAASSTISRYRLHPGTGLKSGTQLVALWFKVDLGKQLMSYARARARQRVTNHGGQQVADRTCFPSSSSECIIKRPTESPGRFQTRSKFKDIGPGVIDRRRRNRKEAISKFTYTKVIKKRELELEKEWREITEFIADDKAKVEKM
ncbi:hypothetical protein J6590_030168 [Homalodisca vitripennis]|nr:hypothetical protein J6590_030168 [Homalodisca vitripennis]